MVQPRQPTASKGRQIWKQMNRKVCNLNLRKKNHFLRVIFKLLNKINGKSINNIDFLYHNFC